MIYGDGFRLGTGLYYYRARYYNPGIGRFLQPDPIGYADSLNLYQYCGNNPVNWIDPWGLDKEKDEEGWLDWFMRFVNTHAPWANTADEGQKGHERNKDLEAQQKADPPTTGDGFDMVDKFQKQRGDIAKTNWENSKNVGKAGARDAVEQVVGRASKSTRRGIETVYTVVDEAKKVVDTARDPNVGRGGLP